MPFSPSFASSSLLVACLLGACEQVGAVQQHERTQGATQALPHEPLPASAGGQGAEHGRALFMALGCGACHTIRGTRATGTVGPDLTHVGSRLSLGAGALDNSLESMIAWLAYPSKIKPGVKMPGYHMLGDDDLLALARYLHELQ